MKRISWLDSCDMYARIHATEDDGISTICGHRPLSETQWKITDQSPRKMHGRSRYCKTCFANGGKTAEWFIQINTKGSKV